MTDRMILELWERARPTVEEYLELLEAAAHAAAGGDIEPQLREEAGGAAHKLAGSLGIYGIAEGSELAHEVEVELEPERDPDPARLGSLVAELRGVIARATAGQ